MKDLWKNLLELRNQREPVPKVSAGKCGCGQSDKPLEPPGLDRKSAAYEIHLGKNFGRRARLLKRLHASGASIFLETCSSEVTVELTDFLRSWGITGFVQYRDHWSPLTVPGNFDSESSNGVKLFVPPNSRTKHIWVFLHSNAEGGAELSNLEFVRDLLENGYLVTVCLPNSKSGTDQNLQSLGCGIRVIPHVSWIGGGHATQDLLSRVTESHVMIAAAMSASSCDLAITQTSVINHGALASKLADKPHVWWLREFGDLDHGIIFPASNAKMGEYFESLSDSVWVNSPILAEHFKLQNFMVREPSPILKNEAPVLAVNSKQIGFVGTLSKGKNCEVLLQAFAAISPDVRHGFSIAIFGDGPEQSNLEASAEALGIRDLVHFFGRAHPDGIPFRDLFCVVVSSLNEAFGRVPWEAAGHGLPVLASKSGGMGPKLKASGFRMLFDPTSFTELSELLSTLMTTASIYESESAFSINAYSEQRQSHRPEILFDQFEEIIKSRQNSRSKTDDGTQVLLEQSEMFGDFLPSP